MIRVVIGSILGGIAQFIVGVIFWGIPIFSRIPFSIASDAQNANVQAALAQNLPQTGTYYIPWPDTTQGTILHGRGPVGLIFYNSHGFPQMDAGSLIAGLIVSIVSIFLLGLALHAIASRVTDFASRARVVVLAAVATVLYFTIATPIYNFTMPWGWWIYLAASQLIGFVIGGLILARWFVPYATARVGVYEDTVH